MALLLFLFYIFLNNRLSPDAGTVQVLVSGVLIVAAVCVFANRALDIPWSAELVFWRILGLLLLYVPVLVWEILKANAAVIGTILRRKPKPAPVIVRFRAPLKRGFTRMILANSITLTPGTVTVDVEGEEYTVHCLDRSMAEGMDDSVFVRLLLRMERAANRVTRKKKRKDDRP